MGVIREEKLDILRVIALLHQRWVMIRNLKKHYQKL